jgi:hypothetical protein
MYLVYLRWEISGNSLGEESIRFKIFIKKTTDSMNGGGRNLKKDKHWLGTGNHSYLGG